MNNTMDQGMLRNHLPGWLVIAGAGAGARSEEETKRKIAAGMDAFDGDYGLVREITTGRGLCFGFRKPRNPLPMTTWSLCAAGGKTCFIEGVFYDEYFSHRPVQGEDRELAELLLAQFSENGKGAIERLNGSFSGFIFDHASGRLITFVDRLGVHVLYWSQEGDTVTVSSNLAAFRRLKTLALDETAAFQFLTIGFPIDERTLLQDVMIQLPCTMNIFDGTSRQSVRYWDLPERMQERSLDDCVEMISRAVEDHVSAIYDRTRRKVSLGISGGHDSRVVLSALASREVPFDPMLWKDGNFNDVVVTKLCSLLGKEPLIINGATDEERKVMQKSIFRYSDGTYLYAYGFIRLARNCFERDVDSLMLGFSGDRISGGLTTPAPRYLKGIDELAVCTLKAQMELLSFSDAETVLKAPDSGLAGTAQSEWLNSFVREGGHAHLADVSIWQGFANRNLKRVRFSMMPAKQYVQPVFPYLDSRVLAAYMSMPVRYLNNQKAHCYAGFHRIRKFGDYRACSYPLPLKSEARFPSALHLARISRQKIKDILPVLGSSNRKDGLGASHDRLKDDLLQSPLFDREALRALVLAGRVGPRDIHKMHTLGRFNDFYILGNEDFLSEAS